MQNEYFKNSHSLINIKNYAHNERNGENNILRKEQEKEEAFLKMRNRL